ncbi:MAG TPA: hypothetical protein VFD64_09900 [Gemmatimonadaceae bacterium]|nr:hypothetical protein [Gemmatimonadaceae bacterium]
MVFTVKEYAFYFQSARRTVNGRVLLREDMPIVAGAGMQRGVHGVATWKAGPNRRELGTLVASASNDFELSKRFDAWTMPLRIHEPLGTGNRPNAHATLWAESHIERENYETFPRDSTNRTVDGRS